MEVAVKVAIFGDVMKPGRYSPTFLSNLLSPDQAE
jgi:hypothetical protein